MGRKGHSCVSELPERAEVRAVLSAEPKTQSFCWVEDGDGRLPVGHPSVLCGPDQPRRYRITCNFLSLQ